MWYFSYGSNMNPEVFETVRKIKCLDHRVCYVPGYVLTFTEGILPYWEPAFCTCVKRGEIPPLRSRNRNQSSDADASCSVPRERERPDIHGVAFLITRDQFEHLLVTEGGMGFQEYRKDPFWSVGGYGVEEVGCIEIDPVFGDENDDGGRTSEGTSDSQPCDTHRNEPTAGSFEKKAFSALTLVGLMGSRQRYDCNASRRYCNLVRVGARSSGLPVFYREYLEREHPAYYCALDDPELPELRSRGIVLAKILFVALSIPCFFGYTVAMKVCPWFERFGRFGKRKQNRDGGGSFSPGSATNSGDPNTVRRPGRGVPKFRGGGRPPWLLMKACHLYQSTVAGRILPAILFDWWGIPCGFHNSEREDNTHNHKRSTGKDGAAFVNEHKDNEQSSVVHKP